MGRDERDGKTVKCVIWDLDNTFWLGTLLEGDDVRLAPGISDVVTRLDECGIVQSIASRNDAEAASRKLEQLGVPDLFLYPRISWNAKSGSVRQIISDLNIGADSVVFVDDSEFEREEVRAGVDGVECLAPEEFFAKFHGGEILPEKVNEDARGRRRFYQAEIRRKEHESAFVGPPQEFLVSLDMVLDVRPMVEEDLERAAELTQRTHQLNTTGTVFSEAELRELMRNPDTLVLMAELKDRFGSYGRIGLCVVDRRRDLWTVELLLMSCRVMGRNVGNTLLAVIADLAHRAGVPLRAFFRPNGRNRQMQVTYGFLGFRIAERVDGTVVYELPDPGSVTLPAYTTVRLDPGLQ